MDVKNFYLSVVLFPEFSNLSNSLAQITMHTNMCSLVLSLANPHYIQYYCPLHSPTFPPTLLILSILMTYSLLHTLTLPVTLQPSNLVMHSLVLSSILLALTSALLLPNLPPILLAKTLSGSSPSISNHSNTTLSTLFFVFIATSSLLSPWPLCALQVPCSEQAYTISLHTHTFMVSTNLHLFFKKHASPSTMVLKQHSSRLPSLLASMVPMSSNSPHSYLVHLSFLLMLCFSLICKCFLDCGTKYVHWHLPRYCKNQQDAEL
eukprot:Phypoly_transcript_15745.p1 GENE.Phypoly_transcript_15745~~Phypoly_transcript_15745.p1  ORF type:complete len:270 (-),score=21.48 Phypoly_transcript_15745:98-886(-)